MVIFLHEQETSLLLQNWFWSCLECTCHTLKLALKSYPITKPTGPTLNTKSTFIINHVNQITMHLNISWPSIHIRYIQAFTKVHTYHKPYQCFKTSLEFQQIINNNNIMHNHVKYQIIPNIAKLAQISCSKSLEHNGNVRHQTKPRSSQHLRTTGKCSRSKSRSITQCNIQIQGNHTLAAFASYNNSP